MKGGTMSSRAVLLLTALLFIPGLILAGGRSESPPEEVQQPDTTAEEVMEDAFEPAYLALHRSGELKERADALWEMMGDCRLCPRECGADRLSGETGFCKSVGTTLHIASYHAHFGEERPLVGTRGSGTIFFTHCGLKCSFCQNWTISHQGRGSEVSVIGLANMMMELQRRGCHNINLVTPTHYTAHILKAVDIAASQGLRIPLVYNTSGWERMEVLKLLDGVVDIYLPDFKYWDSEASAKYSAGAASYPELTKKGLLEMQRQVGTAVPNEQGVMERGLMIRHLVMPNNVSGSKQIMEWIAENLPKDTYVNIMAQYRPSYRAYDYPEISRALTADEYREAVSKALDLGLTNLDLQGFWWAP